MYKQVAYMNLSDSSSLAILEDGEGKQVYAVGYQGDETLHIIDDGTAEELDERGGSICNYYEDYEQEIVEAI